jgi:hypothetical protein
MDLIHALLGSLFTILITASVSFIAYKVLMIGNEVSEVKDLLKQLQRETQGSHSLANLESAASTRFPTPLPEFEGSVEIAAKGKDFVLPPPISRRLDAERGITRDAADDLSLGLKSSGQRH